MKWKEMNVSAIDFKKINNGEDRNGTYEKSRNNKRDKKQDQQELQEVTKKLLDFSKSVA